MKFKILNILIITSFLLSAQVDIFRANKVAANVNKQFNNNLNRNQVTVKSIETLYQDNSAVLYVYNLNPVGFIIIPTTDKVAPYLAYSFDNDFKVSNMPNGFTYTINSYKNYILQAIASNSTNTLENSLLWDDFSDPGYNPREVRDVSPLIDAEFDQSGSWNNTLTAETGFNGPLGCVAVSMGQIMHYWSYPEQGEGTNTYVEDDLGSLTVDFSQAYYDFDTMAATYATNPSRLLLYHCGVAVNMDYESGGSGAQCEGVYPSAEYAMKTFFKYGESIDNIDGDNYDNVSDFRNELKNELNLNRPILFSGFSDSYGNGGHAWNIDGYQNNNLHCNWGWGGWSNGYYSLPSLNGFDTWQNALINIIPEIYENPLALFEYEINDDIVIFIDLSEVVNESEIDSWTWDFGDGSTETNSNGFAEHVYASSGEYNVSLIVTNIYGQTGDPHMETISVGSTLAGDVNGDSILNVLDIVLLVNFVLDASNPTNSEFNAGDMNNDNVLNILDIVSLVNSILNS